jgi:hypothetical protein
MDNWRIYVIVLLMTLSLIDIVCTHYYVSKYKKWQPEKPFNLIEQNPLLVILWTHLGLLWGTIVGAVIILSLIFVIGKSAHPIVIGILFFMLCYAIYNHSVNINLLHKLIDKYPTGKLPETVFGKVVGNNK